MDSSLSILRLFSVLVVFMALVISLFTRQVGAAAAQGAADAAAIAVTDLLPAAWDCQLESPPDELTTKVREAAARAAADRTAQLAAVQPTAVEVRADPTCSVIVSVRVSSAGWLGSRGALGVACRRPPSAEGAALRAPVAPPC
ncbi:hypothetical protein [Candidatus Poriferisodalis sp.]|uniref:hypothetical protein n=1 Tax=Candidatus Poriferisodalis sp. TaxID=3101277 RepID=UPI003B01050D